MDKTTFQENMLYLAAAYDVEITKQRASVFWHQLGELRDEPFKTAISGIVGFDTKFPTVARIREAYRSELRHQAMEQQKAITRRTAPEKSKVTAMINGLRDHLR